MHAFFASCILTWREAPTVHSSAGCGRMRDDNIGGNDENILGEHSSMLGMSSSNGVGYLFDDEERVHDILNCDSKSCYIV
mmetsp:Transcript_5448/g.9296  ORF Transcript_5448/g.9296 Transcript_5448/m.9296 type:complete len:80 (+) Transcript_5448:440-679(+)